tara:strand:+ start:793 stop:1041 length:249 start_codon:yes stop_codon:yes gene_type:complete
MAGTKNQMNRFAKVSNDSYRQKGHPYAVTSCGRRRSYMHDSPNKFKGANSKNSSCWPGYHKEGTKKSPSGAGNGPVNNCVEN